MRQGSTATLRLTHTRNPTIDAEIESKFRTATELRYGKAKADEFLKESLRLDKLTDVTRVLKMFAYRRDRNDIARILF